jgi:hypothetical protein
LLSISALILIFIIGFFSETNESTFFDRSIVGSIFIISLLFGISISKKPGWYKPKKKNVKNNHEKKMSRDFKGHHPNCEGFSDHTIKIKNKTYCAGCLGLSIGSSINIALIITYIIIDDLIIDFRILLLIGIIFVISLFFIFIFLKRKPLSRVVSNAIFILSFFFIIISIIEITGSFIFGLLSGLLCFLFIDTRIKISKWTHINTCINCEKDCKRY